jgi:Mycothiol maleylpyruvate isomerase N-terminal domain
MTTHPDLESAARRMASLVESVSDGVLDQPTPCERYAVGDLLDHIAGFALAFTAAAAKRPLEGGPSGDAAIWTPPGGLASRATSWPWPRRGATQTPGPA